MRRSHLFNGNSSLAESSVVQLAGYDDRVQHVARRLIAFAKTGADDFERNLGILAAVAAAL